MLLFLSASCYVGAVAWWILMEWLRHRPSRLHRSTQDLVLYAALGALLLVGLGSGLLLSSLQSPR